MTIFVWKLVTAIERQLAIHDRRSLWHMPISTKKNHEFLTGKIHQLHSDDIPLDTSSLSMLAELLDYPNKETKSLIKSSTDFALPPFFIFKLSQPQSSLCNKIINSLHQNSTSTPYLYSSGRRYPVITILSANILPVLGMTCQCKVKLNSLPRRLLPWK